MSSIDDSSEGEDLLLETIVAWAKETFKLGFKPDLWHKIYPLQLQPLSSCDRSNFPDVLQHEGSDFMASVSKFRYPQSSETICAIVITG